MSHYDFTLIDPSPTQVRECVTTAIGIANAGGRSRTVGHEVAGTIGVAYAERPEGSLSFGGWGVPNAYRQRASTSVLGVAWFTDPHGRRHVRIYGARVSAPKSAFGSKRLEAFSGDSVVAHVYPWLKAPQLFQYQRKGKRALPKLLVALIDAVAENPLCAASRAALADWHDERGNLAEAREQRRALEVIQVNIDPAPCAVG